MPGLEKQRRIGGKNAKHPDVYLGAGVKQHLLVTPTAHLGKNHASHVHVGTVISETLRQGRSGGALTLGIDHQDHGQIEHCR